MHRPDDIIQDRWWPYTGAMSDGMSQILADNSLVKVAR